MHTAYRNRRRTKFRASVDALESRQLLSTLSVDSLDYAPDSDVHFTGSGFAAYSTVDIKITSTNNPSSPVDVYAKTDSSGNFTVDWNIGEQNLFASLTAVATDGVPDDTSSATFTDSVGAIFTTNYAGTTVNQNIYDHKTDVYLNGGPQVNGGNTTHLPAGDYYFQVTNPGGDTLLSTDDVSLRKVHIDSLGFIDVVYSHNAGLSSHTSEDPNAKSVQLAPFADSSNGEYKVWLTRVQDYDPSAKNATFGFLSSASKTDNFKVNTEPPPPPVLPNVTIDKSATSIQEGGVGTQTVTYTYTITNTSTEAEDMTSVSDNKLGSLLSNAIAANGGVATLAAGSHITFSVGVNFPVANAGVKVDNTVEVDVKDTLGHVASSNASYEVTYQDVLPTIEITKTPNVNSVNLGGTVTYAYTVKNTSQATTDPVTLDSLSDDKLGDLLAAFKAANGGSATLAPGVSITFYVAGAMPTSSTTGSFTNTVNVVGHDDEGDSTHGDATATVTLTFTLSGTKFLDHTGDGHLSKDGTNSYLPGFTVDLYEDVNNNNTYDAGIDQLDATTTTGSVGKYAFSGLTLGKTYFVVEDPSTQPDPQKWVQTGGGSYTDNAKSIIVDVGDLNFANAHIVSHNEYTIGFYKNNGGASLFNSLSPADQASTLATLNALGARRSNGSLATFSSYKDVQTFLGNATATNMANMLSAQLIATQLNVLYGVDGISGSTAIDFALATIPGSGTPLPSSLIAALHSKFGADNFVTINDLIQAAKASLASDPNTTASGPARTLQEALKDCFDSINNGQSIFLV